MPALHRVAWGLLIVIVDFRLEQLDVVPDVLGWALVIAGLVPLAGRHVGFRAALAGATAALVVAALTEYVLRTATGTTLSIEPGGAWGWLHVLLETVVSFGTCTALRSLALSAGDSSTATGANAVRWLDLALTLSGVAMAAAAGFPTEQVEATGWQVPAVLLVGALTVASVVWFLVLLFRGGRAPYVVHAPAAAASS